MSKRHILLDSLQVRIVVTFLAWRRLSLNIGDIRKLIDIPRVIVEMVSSCVQVAELEGRRLYYYIGALSIRSPTLPVLLALSVNVIVLWF